MILRYRLMPILLAFLALPLAHPATAAADGSGQSTPMAVYAWGGNSFGQLDDGTTQPRLTPQPVLDIPAGVSASAISAGWGHAIALGSDGTAYSWGSNDYGQLGARPAVGVSVTAVAAGAAHSLVLGSDGRVYHWGLYWRYYRDDPNQGRTDGVITLHGPMEGLPTDVGFVAITAGGGQSAAVDANGQVWVWGIPDYGYLNAAWDPIVDPESVSGFPSGTVITRVCVGHGHFLALASDGSLYAWGANDKGQLGIGTQVSNARPLPVTGFPAGVHATSICAGYGVSYAIGSDGNLYAWGDNTDGLLGTGAAPMRLTPAVVGGFPSGVQVTAVATGGHTMTFNSDTQHPATVSGATNTLALGSDGKVYGWGGNAHGELGDGTTQPRTSPTLASALQGRFPASAVSVGGDFSLMSAPPAFPAGEYLAFTAQPGNGRTGAPLSPRPVVEVRTPAGAVDTAFNGPVALALKGGTAASHMMGTTRVEAEAGVAEFADLSVDTPGVYRLEARSAGVVTAESSEFTVPIPSGVAALYTWGANDFGQLGIGSTVDMPYPVPVSGLPAGVAIRSFSSGGSRAAAIGSDGNLYVFGLVQDETHSQDQDGDYQCETFTLTLLDETPDSSLMLPDGVHPLFVSAAERQTMALGSDGNVYRWGLVSTSTVFTRHFCLDNVYSYAGSGEPMMTPPAGTHVTAIAAVRGYAAVALSDGTVVIRGNWNYTTDGITSTVTGFPAGVYATALVMGSSQYPDVWFALGSDGKAYRWQDGTTAALPFDIGPSGGSVTAISMMARDLLALGSDGRVYDSAAPATPVTGFPSGVTVRAIAGGDTHALALGSDGRVYAWGSNGYGQLGFGDTVSRAAPTPLTLLPAGMVVTGIAAGGADSAILVAPMTAYSGEDVARALGIAGGLVAGTVWDGGLNVWNAGASAGGINMDDAVHLARHIAGLE